MNQTLIRHCAIVGARLDYCNSLLYGVSSANLRKLQRVQNTLARVATGSIKRDHIMLVLQALHRLPVNFRITYKIAILTNKVKQSRQPKYLSEYIQPLVRSRYLRLSDYIQPLVRSRYLRLSDYIQPLVRSRYLRSSGTDLLYIHDSNLAPTNISCYTFSFVAPTIWNSLPIHLRSLATASSVATFNQHLKSYLFNLPYRM